MSQKEFKYKLQLFICPSMSTIAVPLIITVKYNIDHVYAQF